MRDRSLGTGPCPCYVRIFYQVIGGDVSSFMLRLMARLFIDNPEDKELYHCALEIQLPEEGHCCRYIIELTDHVDADEAGKVGQIIEGDAGSLGASMPGFEYGIRLWRGGSVNQGGPDRGGKDPFIAVRGDCAMVREILKQARAIPANDYTPEWTSNSVVFWLLERAGYDTSKVPELSDGLTPNRANGAAAGKAARKAAKK